MTRTNLVCVLVLAACLYAQAQPYSVTPNEFEPALLEPAQRAEDNYTGFVYNFNGAPTSDQTPNGMLQVNQANTNPFLSTLPGDGNGQTIVTLGPCASNTPHTHPRGSEISFLLYGAIEFGMVEENGGKNQLVIRNITQNETIHIPTGILHFSYNPNCSPAAFLANFATKDPGTQTTYNSLMQIPNHILNAATGIPEAQLSSLKSSFPLVTPPGTGGEACMQKCGLNFTTANKLTPMTNTS